MMQTKTTIVDAGQRLWEPFIVPSQPSELGRPRKGTLNNPSPWQQYETAPRLWQPNRMQFNAVAGRCFGALSSGITLIDIDQRHLLMGNLLNRFGQFGDLRTVLLRRRRHVQRQQMAQRIDSQVDFGAPFPLGPVAAGPLAAFDRRLKRTAVEDGSRGIGLPPCGQPQQASQIMDEVFEDSGFDPAPGLLLDGVPRWQVARHHAPGGTGTHHPAQAIVDLALGMIALGSVFSHERQVRGHEGAFSSLTSEG